MLVSMLNAYWNDGIKTDSLRYDRGKKTTTRIALRPETKYSFAFRSTLSVIYSLLGTVNRVTRDQRALPWPVTTQRKTD